MHRVKFTTDLHVLPSPRYVCSRCLVRYGLVLLPYRDCFSRSNGSCTLPVDKCVQCPAVCTLSRVQALQIILVIIGVRTFGISRAASLSMSASETRTREEIRVIARSVDREKGRGQRGKGETSSRGTKDRREKVSCSCAGAAEGARTQESGLFMLFRRAHTAGIQDREAIQPASG